MYGTVRYHIVMLLGTKYLYILIQLQYWYSYNTDTYLSLGMVTLRTLLATHRSLNLLSTARQCFSIGPKTATSNGWVRCVEFDGRKMNLIKQKVKKNLLVRYLFQGCRTSGKAKMVLFNKGVELMVRDKKKRITVVYFQTVSNYESKNQILCT